MSDKTQYSKKIYVSGTHRISSVSYIGRQSTYHNALVCCILISQGINSGYRNDGDGGSGAGDDTRLTDQNLLTNSKVHLPFEIS
jgi:hypothetical protein